jgi:hypothetical protein
MIPLDQITGTYATLQGLFSAISKDAINGCFELAAGFFVLNHCRVLYAHKLVRGVSLTSSGFFLIWGMWNMYYYPALNQPLSFYGGVFVVAANGFYLGMLFHFRRLEAMNFIFDEHQLYLAPESTCCIPKTGDQ